MSGAETLEAEDQATQQLLQQMQFVCSGHDLDIALTASIAHLAAVIGFSSSSQDEADKMIDYFLSHARRHVRANWADSREARSRSIREGALSRA